MTSRVTARGRLLVDGRDVAPVEVATTNRQRRKGLLGRDGLDGGFVLHPCRQVHTLRMRFPIDVAYLGRDGEVLTVRELPPGRFGPLLLRSRSILEAAAGSFDAWDLRTGSSVSWTPCEDRP